MHLTNGHVVGLLVNYSKCELYVPSKSPVDYFTHAHVESNIYNATTKKYLFFSLERTILIPIECASQCSL